MTMSIVMRYLKSLQARFLKCQNLIETFWLQEGDQSNFLMMNQKMNNEVKNIKNDGIVQISILKYFFNS